MSGRLILKSFYIRLLSIALISCLGIIVYSNTFHCSFHFDDANSITDNFSIKDISNLQNIWDFWPSRFITYFSIAFNYHFSGLDVFGYHLFNLGVHIISAILVWWLVLLTLSTPAMKEQKITQQADFIALFAGLVFVSHPIQTQAITYIVQRAASMAALFYLASLCFYIKSRLLQDTSVIASKAKQSFKKIASSPMAPRNDTLGKFYYVCSLITAVMAMFTKELAISLPLMILLYEFSFLKSKKSFNWGHAVPFLLTIFIIPLTVSLTTSIRLSGEDANPISSTQYLLTQFRVIVTYVRLVFLPLNQNLDYDYSLSNSLFELPTLCSFLFLTVVLFWAKCLFSKYRLVSFSIFWFFLALLPESSLFPIKDVIYEHRLYLPLVGYSIFLVSGVYYLFRKNTIKMMVMTLTMIIACNAVLTYQRNKIWLNDITLWDDVARKSPHKRRPFFMRGLFYNQQGNLPQALSDFNRAIEIDPNYAGAYNERGKVYSQQGNLPQALSDFNRAVELNHNFAEAYNNRGNIYKGQGNLTGALSDFNRAIEIKPKYEFAFANRGNTYTMQGDLTDAISDLSKAIELSPDFAGFYNDRGFLYARKGDFTKAWEDIHQAEKLGASVNPQLLNALKQASQRDQ